MGENRLTLGLATGSLGLVLGTVFFVMCIALRNEPIVGESATGFQGFLVQHIVGFGAFFFGFTLLAFLGQLAKARGRPMAGKIRAAVFWVAAVWLLTGATSEMVSLLSSEHGVRWPPPGVRWTVAVVSVIAGAILILVGARAVRTSSERHRVKG